jgi:hypothetical protein
MPGVLCKRLEFKWMSINFDSLELILAFLATQYALTSQLLGQLYSKLRTGIQGIY